MNEKLLSLMVITKYKHKFIQMTSTVLFSHLGLKMYEIYF